MSSSSPSGGGSSSSGLLNHSLSIRQEIQRFESVHPSIYAIYDLIELVPDPLLAQQIREHVVCIEGRLGSGSRPNTSAMLLTSKLRDARDVFPNPILILYEARGP